MRCGSREAGLTTVELAIVAVVLSLVVGTVAMSFGTTFGMWRSSGARRTVDRQANRGLDKTLNELSRASAETVLPVLIEGQSSPYLSFKGSTGLASGTITLGPTVQIEWAADPSDPEDGKDNNGNGMVDEGIVLLRVNPDQTDESKKVLARGVSNLLGCETMNDKDDNGNGLVDEKGLCFERKGDVLTVRMTVLRRGDDDELIRRTVEGSIALR